MLRTLMATMMLYGMRLGLAYWIATEYADQVNRLLGQVAGALQ